MEIKLLEHVEGPKFVASALDNSFSNNKENKPKAREVIRKFV